MPWNIAEGYNVVNNQFIVFNKEELEISYSPSGNAKAAEEKKMKQQY